MEAGRQMDTMVLFNVSLGLAPVASTFTATPAGWRRGARGCPSTSREC
jgi:hypothetical protein